MDKHLRGVHKLQVTTKEDLRQKMLAEGSGYNELIQRERLLRYGENISMIDCPSSQCDTKDFT